MSANDLIRLLMEPDAAHSTSRVGTLLAGFVITLACLVVFAYAAAQR